MKRFLRGTKNTRLVGTSPLTLTNLVCHSLCRNHKSGHVSQPEACHRIRVCHNLESLSQHFAPSYTSTCQNNSLINLKIINSTEVPVDGIKTSNLQPTRLHFQIYGIQPKIVWQPLYWEESSPIMYGNNPAKTIYVNNPG